MTRAARAMRGKNLAEMKRATLRLYRELTKTVTTAANTAMELAEEDQ